MQKKLILLLGLALVLFPLLVFAQSPACPTSPVTLGTILCQIGQLLKAIVPILVALGLIYFIWGVIRYVIADSEEDKQKGRDVMIYGVIGFTVIVGIWGIVNVLLNTFGFTPQDLSAPQLSPVVGAGTGCSSIGDASTLQDVLCFITGVINNSIIPLIFAVAFVMFIWGVIKFFIIGADEEASRTEGKQFIIWGVIAMTVMVGIWGLVKIVGGTFGLNTSILPQVTPPGQSSSPN